MKIGFADWLVLLMLLIICWDMLKETLEEMKEERSK